MVLSPDGVIDGSLVYVYSQDATVLNGTVGEMHAKGARLYDFAMKTGAPDRSDRLRRYASAGSNRCTELGFGEIYMQQTKASGVIPQITGIFGTCGGGMAINSGTDRFYSDGRKKQNYLSNSPNAIEMKSQMRYFRS